jgi:hypothetical protein
MKGTFKLEENLPALLESSSNQCCGLSRIPDVCPETKNNKRKERENIVSDLFVAKEI